jgi:hypothetical protein
VDHHDSSPPGDGGDGLAADLTEADEEPDEDEFDPFAEYREDPPPEYEGDDRVHEGEA